MFMCSDFNITSYFSVFLFIIFYFFSFLFSLVMEVSNEKKMCRMLKLHKYKYMTALYHVCVCHLYDYMYVARG